MKKTINGILYFIAVSIALGILYDIIVVSDKELALVISLAVILVMAMVNAWWGDCVAIYEYRKWYNALPAHHQNQIDLYKHTSRGYHVDKGTDLFNYDTYGKSSDSDSNDDHTPHIVV